MSEFGVTGEEAPGLLLLFFSLPVILLSVIVPVLVESLGAPNDKGKSVPPEESMSSIAAKGSATMSTSALLAANAAVGGDAIFAAAITDTEEKICSMHRLDGLVVVAVIAFSKEESAF